MSVFRKSWIVAVLSLAGLVMVSLVLFQFAQERSESGSGVGNAVKAANNDTSDAKSLLESNGVSENYIDGTLEIPFLGRTACKSRVEKVAFQAGEINRALTFKTYYTRNNVLIRAEYAKPGARDYECSPQTTEEIFFGRFLKKVVGIPPRPAPASLSVVLQSLYSHEPFDRASKIVISWFLIEDETGKKTPWYIANVYGVSQGLMNTPSDDEGFLKYRIWLTPQGEAVFSDNQL